MSQRFIIDRIILNDPGFLSEAQAGARGGLEDHEKNSIDKIFDRVRSNDLVGLQEELRSTNHEVRSLVIRSGAISDLIPEFTDLTLEKLFKGGVVTGDYTSLDILCACLDPDDEGKRIAGVASEAFCDAVIRDDIDAMDWLWDLTDWSKRLISAHEYHAFYEACDSESLKAVRWMLEKASDDVDMCAAMNRLLTPALRNRLEGDTDSDALTQSHKRRRYLNK